VEFLEDKICLDTDFLVNFLRNKKEDVDFIVQKEQKVIFATTFINLFELYYGAYKSGSLANVLRVEELQHRLNILNLSNEAVKKAGQVLATLEKKGELIDFRDLLIGCVAETESFCLKTYNRKHFQRIPELVLHKSP